MRDITPKDLENPKRKSGYNHVISVGAPGPSGGGGGGAWRATKRIGAKRHGWSSPRRATALEAAQDYCDYINGQSGTTTAALASHGHKRVKAKRKIEYSQRELDARKVLREEAAKRKVEQGNYVYLVGMIGNPAYVKIGEAFDPEDRYMSGQTFNPYTLTLLGYYKTDIPRDADKAVHQELAESHHKAEWFRPTDAVLSKFSVSRSEFLRRCGGKTKEVKTTA